MSDFLFDPDAQGSAPTPTDRVTLSIELTFVMMRDVALDSNFQVYLQAQLDQLLAGLKDQGAELGGQATVVEVFAPSQGVDLTQPNFPMFRRGIQ